MTEPKAASPTAPEPGTVGGAVVLSEAEAIEALADLLFELWREECARKERAAA